MSKSGGPYKPGQRFGPYRLEEYLGSGAFKSVYRAERIGAQGERETLALGFPHHQDADGLAELEKELAASSRLVHPNILRVHGVERHEGVGFLVMEHLQGESLRALMRRRGRMPAQEALRYAGLLAEALSHAHAAHVLHRDVKPENIFVTADGTPKLLDFGVGRILAYTADVASTRVGTIPYMAPEQFRGAAGTNADLWSLGITFHEMLVGAHPFAGQTAEVIHNIMHAPLDEQALRQAGVDGRIVLILRKMLDKDPERRYRTADELADELELAARRARLVEDDEGRLEVIVRASFPLVYVVSFEEERVLEAVRRIAGQLGEERGRPRSVYVWSASRGLRDGEGNLVSPQTLEDPTAALIHAIENPADAIYAFLDMHRHFSPVTVRLVRDTARAVRATRKSLLFLSPFCQIPAELDKEVTLAMFQLPDRRQLEPALASVAAEMRAAGLPADLDEDARQALLRAASGLTLDEARRAIAAAAIAQRGLTREAARAVAHSKSQAIRKSGVLEYCHSSETAADVGGLEALQAWFRQRYPAFASTARYAGLPVPKGAMLVGVPGCGKSLSARALAGTWGVPLVRLDIGRLFASIVGASEANMRQAIQTAEAVSPCVLWLDEIEKGFAGVGGPTGGRVAARLFGAFLSWLQDKTSPVFVVATANDVAQLPPELLRKGRFDDVFFVGLPAPPEREAVFRIHLAKRRREPDAFDLPALANATNGFSGAEIEQAVNDAMFSAFAESRDLSSGDILQAAGQIIPLSQSRAKEIGQLTLWAETNARPASAAKAGAPR